MFQLVFNFKAFEGTMHVKCDMRDTDYFTNRMAVRIYFKNCKQTPTVL